MHACVIIARNVDSQGTARGSCTAVGCTCKQFSYIHQHGTRCSVCGHAPVKHGKTNIIWGFIGKCACKTVLHAVVMWAN